MDILKISAATRKLQYATEALRNHDCTGDNCERCKNADQSAAEAINDVPVWFLRTATILAVIIIVIIWPYQQLKLLWCKLFHNHIHESESEK